MAVKRSLRFQILRRDNHTCQYCGATAPDVKLTVDHVVPEALGGTDDPANLVTACDPCNGGKSATPPDAARIAAVAQDALRWGAAMRRAAEQMLAERDALAERMDRFNTRWHEFGYGPDDDRHPVPLPVAWEGTIERLLGAGLPMPLLLDCIPIAMGANTVALDRRFNYFCGVAWNRVTTLQDTARDLLDDRRTTTTPQPMPRWQQLVKALEVVLDRCDPPLPAWEYDRIVLDFLTEAAGT